MKLALALHFLLMALFQARALDFSQMEDGDRIEVTLHSVGCFHDFTCYYEVRKDKDSHFFTEYAIKWKRSPVPEIEEKMAEGTLRLTPQEIIGLDALLGYYRGKKDGGSTTQVDLVVEFFERGRRVGLQKLYDQTGGLGLMNRKDLVTFNSLSRRLKETSSR